MSFFKYRVAHPIIRNSLCLLFGYLPYGPIRRENRQDLSGPVILAPTHDNFACDISVMSAEGPQAPRWIAKASLFRGPFNAVMRFLDAYPVVRIVDSAGMREQTRAINEKSYVQFRDEMEAGQLCCMLPEGGSLPRPGLALPLKNGIAKLSLEAEAAQNFELGIRIVPIALLYGDREKFASGLTIRYGRPLYLQEYKAQYEKDRIDTVRNLMKDLTQEFFQIYPHYEDYETRSLARDLEELGIVTRDRVEISRSLINSKARNGPQLAKLQTDTIEFSAEIKRLGVPRGYWISQSHWKKKGFLGRLYMILFVFALAPLAIFSHLNNGPSTLLIRGMTRKISSLVPDFMTLWISLTLLLVPWLLLGQWFLAVFLLGAPVFAYVPYLLFSIFTWFVEHQWRRKFLQLWHLRLKNWPIWKAQIVPINEFHSGLQDRWNELFEGQ